MNQSVYSQNVLIEDFNYPVADSLDQVGNWFRTGLRQQFHIRISNPGLEYTGYAGSGVGNTSQIKNEGLGNVVLKSFTHQIDSGAAYMSFMLRVDTLLSTFKEAYIIGFNPQTGGTNVNTRLMIRRITDQSFNIGTGDSETEIKFNNKVFNINKTILIVLKYSFLPGNKNDLTSVYAFESGVPATEPNLSLVDLVSYEDFDNQGYVVLNNNYAQNDASGCDIKIDGIRVGNSWETSVLSTISSSNNLYNISVEYSIGSYPNPMSEIATLHFSVPEKAYYSIVITNLEGKTVDRPLYKELSPGKHELTLESKYLLNGTYICLLSNGIKTVANKIIVK